VANSSQWRATLYTLTESKLHKRTIIAKWSKHEGGTLVIFFISGVKIITFLKLRGKKCV